MEPAVKEIETVSFGILKDLSIRATKKAVNRDYRKYLKSLGVRVYG